MKNITAIIALVFFTLLFTECEQKVCCTPPPIESQFEGKWELVMVTNGFAQIELEGDEIGYTETIEFNGSRKTFERIRDGKRELLSSFTIGQENDQDAVILEDDNSYHWYIFLEEDGVQLLSLYQKATLGAVLADGSDYKYKRIN